MHKFWKIKIIALLLAGSISCTDKQTENRSEVQAIEILGNPKYQAVCYGGYRANTREIQPSIEQIKEDMLILTAMGIKIIRTYNVHLPEASNILKAIDELKKADPAFEMYVMLGAWIDCKNAWTGLEPDHFNESERNEQEIATAVKLANQYPHIVKILAVGNEAMVRWAASYYVQPSIILKWVNHLQALKKEGKLNKDLWITSSDDFASWGGGDASYHSKDLEDLIKAVDFISMHTYPFHNSHYNPAFWSVPETEQQFSEIERVHAAMLRAQKFAQAQYDSVVGYIKSIGVNKPVHIGETGWASASDGFYGDEGSRAADEYKQALYYQLMRDWTNKAGISCFYFEAFDEPWKDAQNSSGSENHFGLFTVKGQAKFALWNLADQQTFTGLKRDGNEIIKTFGGDSTKLLLQVKTPPYQN
ncbi:MAG TPA: glycosyl hydrolase family 17 protein [Cyclobacteriaceae bacterium]|nr:glycosyl hydrolase family 17 protein [Cyclobacteriaceae bacterium]